MHIDLLMNCFERVQLKMYIILNVLIFFMHTAHHVHVCTYMYIQASIFKSSY